MFTQLVSPHQVSAFFVSTSYKLVLASLSLLHLPYYYYILLLLPLPPHRLTKKSIMDHDEVTYGTSDAIPDFRAIAGCLMNRPPRRDGRWSSTETRLFREFFGTSERVVEVIWELIVRDELRPRGGRPEHLLWPLHFLKVYPKQGPGCAVVRTSNGAVDAKTHQKWVWAFVDAIAKLVDVVVSIFYWKNTHNVRRHGAAKK